VSCELPQAEWDFRDVPSAELSAACVWEAARESKRLTNDHSLLDVLPSSTAIGWLLELRGLFRSQFFGSDFLSGPWMHVTLECRYWLHQKIRDVRDGGYHCWLSHWEVDESIQIYGYLEPGGERRGRQKSTGWQAWLRAIGVRRLRKRLTVAQIFQLYKEVGIVGLDWSRIDEVERLKRQQSLERVIKRDAANVDRILLTLLPSVFAEEFRRGD
jgi:hypothetical protein